LRHLLLKLTRMRFGARPERLPEEQLQLGSTLSFWMGYAAAEFAPVVTRSREMMLASTQIFDDETVVPVLDPRRGRAKKGPTFGSSRATIGHGAAAIRRQWFTITRRAGNMCTALFAGYRGILQSYGYAAYTKVAVLTAVKNRA
jgi:hypothetical protein